MICDTGSSRSWVAVATVIGCPPVHSSASKGDFAVLLVACVLWRIRWQDLTCRKSPKLVEVHQTIGHGYWPRNQNLPQNGHLDGHHFQKVLCFPEKTPIVRLLSGTIDLHALAGCRFDRNPKRQRGISWHVAETPKVNPSLTCRVVKTTEHVFFAGLHVGPCTLTMRQTAVSVFVSV